MALAKNDLILLLTDIQNKGKDIGDNIQKVLKDPNIPVDVLKFINDNRPLDILEFYNHIRKNYNHKKSQLYGSIVKEVDNPEEVLTTLGSLNLQILLYSKKVDNPRMFLKHARAKEIAFVLAKYYDDYDLTSCLKLLRIIKADLKVLESIKN
nr:MAG TPA: hypothetical protein [Caudoviricetes sp.]